jgi:hypothetical protein
MGHPVSECVLEERCRTISINTRGARACRNASLQVTVNCIICFNYTPRSSFVVERSVQSFVSLTCSRLGRWNLGSSSFCASRRGLGRQVGQVVDHLSRASDCAGRVSMSEAMLLHEFGR